MISFQDKIVLVTGATGQLGRNTCRAFKQQGATVVGLDLPGTNDNNIEDFDLFLDLDIANKGNVSDAFEKVFKEYGRIDVLINNAGVSTFEPFEDRAEDSFEWVTDVNLKGTFFCIQELAKLSKKYSFEASIVNIASMYGVISPDPRIYTDCERKNSEVYGATKAGIIQMTKYFAVHLAEQKIRVNSVSPGGIFNPDNPQGPDFIKHYSFRCPMGRMANAEEMVGGILYLASDIASYTNGHNLVIDGAMSSW